MAKRMLAEILWEAANERLRPSAADCNDLWSCNAALLAEFPNEGFTVITRCGIGQLRKKSKSNAFLRSLGCDVSANNAFDFARDASLRETQGTRYMWLLLAMHVAEDEGIEIEVEA